MTTPEIKNLLETGQNLASLTKSYVDTNVKEGVSNIDRQAAIGGYLALLFSAGEGLAIQLSKPPVANVFAKLGGVAAVAGAGLPVSLTTRRLTLEPWRSAAI